MGARIVCAAFLILACSLSAAPVRADPAPEQLRQRVEELARWIASRTDYAAPLQQEPRFAFLSPEVIRHAFAGKTMGYSSRTSSVRAAQKAGTIYLPNSFRLGPDDYILLHELVHHMQDESGKRFECMAEREREAYRLQTAFVEETGIGEKPNDMFMLMLRCDIR